MKENSKTTSRKVKEFRSTTMEISMWENSREIKGMGLERC